MNIFEKVLGAEHPKTASVLNNLANLYDSQGEYGKASPLYERALAIAMQKLGKAHPDTILFAGNLAKLRQKRPSP